MRDKKAKKLILEPDSLYQSRIVTRLINRLMKDGKKSVAVKQVYRALELVEAKTKKPALDVLRQALENIKPVMEVRPRRIGGAAYQVPTPVRGDRRESLAIKWLIIAARERPNKDYKQFNLKLSAEIFDALNNSGGAIRRRDAMQKMADANRAFAHFRW